MEQLKGELLSIIGFLDWYGTYIPNYSKERLEIQEFLNRIDERKHLQHSPQLLSEALHMCKIIRDRNQNYHEKLQELARTLFQNYPDSQPRL